MTDTYDAIVVVGGVVGAASTYGTKEARDAREQDQGNLAPGAPAATG